MWNSLEIYNYVITNITFINAEENLKFKVAEVYGPSKHVIYTSTKLSGSFWAAKIMGWTSPVDNLNN